MFRIKILTLPTYIQYRENISLMNRMVLEELQRHLFNCDQAPYDYYNADNIISPQDKENHAENFPKVKPQAIELLESWVLVFKDIIDESDVKALNFIRHNIIHSKDMVELVWYSTLLLDAVQKFYVDHDMKLDGSGNQFWRM